MLFSIVFDDGTSTSAYEAWISNGSLVPRLHFYGGREKCGLDKFWELEAVHVSKSCKLAWETNMFHYKPVQIRCS